MMETVEYDFREDYKKMIEEHVKTIKSICNEHDIPFCIEIAVLNENGKTEYTQEHLLPCQKNMRLFDDRLSDVHKIMAGYNLGKTSIMLPDIDDSDTL